MKRILSIIVLLAACAAPTPPPPAPAPAPQPVTPVVKAPIGTVRVTASVLNVRKQPSLSGEVITQVKKGDRLSLLDEGDEWMHVRLGNADVEGYVSAGLVKREGVANKVRKGCPADTDFSFAKTPMPAFTENSTAHGIVTVDATVNIKGEVTSTKIISNTTGDESLGVMAQHEIQQARFVAPIRNCAPRPFIFTYKRSY